MKTLFDPALTHRDDPISSYEGADLALDTLEKQKGYILEVLKRHDRPEGYTYRELAHIMYHPTLSEHELYILIAKRMCLIGRDGNAEVVMLRQCLINPTHKKSGKVIAVQAWRAVAENKELLKE